MRSLEAFWGGRPRRAWKIAPDCRKNPAPESTMGEARGRASFIVIIGLESPPVLIGMDIMRPLRVHIDVTRGTATPAQPDPQTIHLNAAQTPTPPVSCALLLQAVDIPAETARLVRCHNPWPSEDVYFCPEEGLPTFVLRSARPRQWIRGLGRYS